MISDTEIEEKAKQLEVSPQDVERDYVHGWLLKEIYSAPLGNRLILKGGNGIRKGYVNGARYSKDLDFSCATELDEQDLHDQLQNILVAASTGSGVEFSLDRTRIAEKRLNIAGVKATEARVYFKGFYALESITLRSHLDITELEKSYLPVQSRPLIHPYSDSSKCLAELRCQKLEEILASKLTTLLFRRKAQDLFDLIFALFFNPELQISRGEIIRTFLKKSIFDPEARQAREQLLAVPIQLFSTLWTALAIPNTSRLAFEVVPSRFNELIQDLFGLLSPEASVSPSGLYGRAPSARAFPPVSRSFVLGPFFGANERNIIIEAGRSRRTIEASYHGVRRVIEPYKLEFKIRKRDNQGFEYFYGWDQSGGRTSPPGMKSFFSNELRDVVATDTKFIPRYEVEF